MNRKFHIYLLAALAASTVVFAQETQPGQGEQPSQEQPAQPEPDAGKTPLPDIDVWEDTEEGKDDVFVPSESISADSSIAFPSDI
jgi:hypothetical protein